jgi:hypothetical protein
MGCNNLQVMTNLEVKDKANDRQPLKAYTLEFLPPLVVKNTLPCEMRFRLPMLGLGLGPEAIFTVKPGDKVEICSMNISKEKDVAFELFPPDTQKPIALLLPKRDRYAQQLHADVQPVGCFAQPGFRAVIVVTVDARCGQMTVEASSPCWVYNKSGLPLELSGSISHMLQPGRADTSLLCPSTRGALLPAALELPVLLGSARARPRSLSLSTPVSRTVRSA